MLATAEAIDQQQCRLIEKHIPTVTRTHGRSKHRSHLVAGSTMPSGCPIAMSSFPMIPVDHARMTGKHSVLHANWARCSTMPSIP